MQPTQSPTAFAGSPKQNPRAPFSLTLRTNDTAYCPCCGNQLNPEATGIRYGVAWCWTCFNREDDYPLRIAMMIICQPLVGHLSCPKGITFYTPRLNNPGSYPRLAELLRNGDGRCDVPDYGNTWPRWIPPHAEVIIYALEHHLLHPDVLLNDTNALNQPRHGVSLHVLHHGTR